MIMYNSVWTLHLWYELQDNLWSFWNWKKIWWTLYISIHRCGTPRKYWFSMKPKTWCNVHNEEILENCTEIHLEVVVKWAIMDFEKAQCLREKNNMLIICIAFPSKGKIFSKLPITYQRPYPLFNLANENSRLYLKSVVPGLPTQGRNQFVCHLWECSDSLLKSESRSAALWTFEKGKRVGYVHTFLLGMETL